MPAMSKQIGLSREGSSRSGGGDPRLDPGPFSTKPARRRPRVLFVGTAFYGLSQTYSPLAPAPVYLDWQHRNLKMLESFPIELIHKPHPGGLFVGRPPGMDHLARIDPRQVVHARYRLLRLRLCGVDHFLHRALDRPADRAAGLWRHALQRRDKAADRGTLSDRADHPRWPQSRDGGCSSARNGIVRLTGSGLKNLQSRPLRLQVDATRPRRRLGLV